jgi:membrane-bound lytic murein transglycosylase MltF
MSGRRAPYEASLKALNQKLEAAGKPPVIIEAAPDDLEDDDLLEMVNAGLIPAAVAHDYLARFWKKVFPGLVLHENIPVRAALGPGCGRPQEQSEIARRPQHLHGQVRPGSGFASNVERKYLVNTTYVKSAASEDERQKFLTIVDLFKKYGEKYDMDFLLMAAQGYQESRSIRARRVRWAPSA